ncbi:hypothetical protein V2I01_36535 [Micromonospora sp. BRA006-A]|nr:hypothetical protein [Micromonospora sp. BRA006-A]
MTVVVIVLIMLVQGTTLPAVVSWAGLTGDRERDDEVRWAGSGPPRPPWRRCPGPPTTWAPQDTVDRLRADYEEHLADARDPGGEDAEAEREMARRLRLRVLDHKRQEITRLRNTRQIDDAVLRQLQAAIDIEEIRLLGPEMEE